MRAFLFYRFAALAVSFAVLAFGFQQCAPARFSVDETSLSSTGSNYCENNQNDPACQKPPPAPQTCELNGQILRDGESQTTFQNSSVPFGQQCVSEVRVCKNGVLSGSFPYALCQTAGPNSCLFAGQTIPHGGSVTAYLSSSTPYGTACSQQTRTCSDGVLSGSYSHATCTPAQPASCLFNSSTVLHGQTVPAYQNSNVPYNQTCVQELRQCLNGTLTGSFNHSSCQVGTAKTCSFNGATIAHGQTVPAFQNSTVPFGQVCSQEQRTCTDGVLSGSFQFGSCAAGRPADCQFNGMQIPHEGEVSAFLTSTVPFGSSCQEQKRQCYNGTLSGTYTFGSCTPAQPASCLFAGKTIAHGERIQAFPSSSVPWDQNCNPEERVCNNGSLSGSASYLTCAQNVPASCLLPSGLTMAHGQTKTFWSSTSVPYGSTCESQNRTCTNGVLSGTFTAESCSTDQTQNTTLAVQQTSQYAPFKLLLIIDNSGSMQKYQTQIASNLDSLLTPLRGKDVDLKIVTTSDYGDQFQTVTEFVRADQSLVQKTSPSAVSPTAYAEYYDNQFTSVHFRKEFIEAPGIVYNLKSTDSATALDSKVAAVKSYIGTIGTSGSSTEKVFCPLSRHIKNRGTSSFFQSQDRMAVVVLTDEDDSSSQSGCVAENSQTFGALALTDGFSSATYNYSYKMVRVRFSYKKTTGAHLDSELKYIPAATENLTDGSWLLSSSIVTEQDALSGTCSAKAQAYLRGLGILSDQMALYSSSYDFQSATVSGCSVETITGNTAAGDLSSISAGANACLSGALLNYFQSSPPTDPSSTPVFYNYQTQTSDYSNKYRPSTLDSCQQVATYTPSNSSRAPASSAVNSYYYAGGPNLLNTSFDTATVNQLSALSGSKFFMSLIYVNSGNCAGAFGQRYSNIVGQFPTQVESYPICASSYGPALSKISQFVIESTVTTYPLVLPAGSRIVEVSLLRGGATSVISPTLYTWSNGQLELRISLQAGDQIKVQYAPR